jgi:hypothetical protein
MMLGKEKWKFGKRFVYTITYDEGFVDLFENTVPIHKQFGFPGHLALVVGQIGQPRNVLESSWNGKRHMNVEQVKELVAMGWGVSSHSMTHGARRSMYTNTYHEVVESRERLEDLLAIPVTSFIVPYDNENHPPVVDIARQGGYLSVYTLTDALNDYGTDLYSLHRSPLIEEGFYPFYTRLDHYYRLHEARESRGWVVDYTHLTNPTIESPQKEITQKSLLRRLEKVREVGSNEVWIANGDEVVDYMLVNRGTTADQIGDSNSTWEWTLRAKIPNRVQRRLLTFSVEIPTQKAGMKPSIRTEPTQVLTHEEVEGGKCLFSLNVVDGLRISISYPF